MTARRRGAFDLSGRVVIVTGATRGIGRELAFLLAETGGVVAATGRSARDLDGLRCEAADKGLPVEPVLLDVRHTESIDAAVADVVNLRGLFFVSQAAARAMIPCGGGRIINISSQGGVVGLPGTAPLLDGPGLREQVLAKIPLRQLGTPADVAGAVVYLATMASRLAPGTVLMADGGWTAQ